MIVRHEYANGRPQAELSGGTPAGIVAFVPSLVTGQRKRLRSSIGPDQRGVMHPAAHIRAEVQRNRRAIKRGCIAHAPCFVRAA